MFLHCALVCRSATHPEYSDTVVIDPFDTGSIVGLDSSIEAVGEHWFDPRGHVVCREGDRASGGDAGEVGVADTVFSNCILRLLVEL